MKILNCEAKEKSLSFTHEQRPSSYIRSRGVLSQHCTSFLRDWWKIPSSRENKPCVKRRCAIFPANIPHIAVMCLTAGFLPESRGVLYTFFKVHRHICVVYVFIPPSVSQWHCPRRLSLARAVGMRLVFPCARWSWTRCDTERSLNAWQITTTALLLPAATHCCQIGPDWAGNMAQSGNTVATAAEKRRSLITERTLVAWTGIL